MVGRSVECSILILEDDADRQRRFAAVADAMGLGVRIWYDAWAMIDEWETSMPRCALFSLDCDLIPPDGSDRWGDGIVFAEHLAARPPIAPVIVHSTNREGSRRMMAVLLDAAWPVRRVAPIGDDWIERDWRAEVALSIGL